MRESTLVKPLLGHALWAESYDSSPNPLLRLEERTMTRRLPDVRNRCVADLACGTGRWLGRLLELGAASCVGIDFSPEMIGRASRKTPLAGRLALAELTRLPLRRASLDLAVCSFALGYLNDLEPLAEECQRVLKPDGWLFCSDLHPATQQLGWRRSFKQGAVVIEIESRFHPVEEVQTAFQNHLELKSLQTAFIGDPERPIFQKAGKLDVFEEARTVPAVVLYGWQKPG
ncbi:MAG: class I SAM-dependent methyltransferase [Acidobacteria bacterium]|nr:class I SAM-dependent methyltransferase [Acidobacteriota bacterium]